MSKTAARIILFCLIGPLALLAGCAIDPAPVIQGACKVPEKLDYEAKKPEPFLSIDTPLTKHLQDEAKERSEHATLADDYNALRGHVKGCHE